MIRPNKYIASLVLMISLILNRNASAQTYPVQISTQLIPPYNGYLPDYADPSSEKLKVILQFNDFTVAQYNLRLKIEIKGNGFTLVTKSFYNPPPITLQPGQPLLLSGADLAPYLNSNNLDFIGLNQSSYEQRMALPEGYYSICIKAYDYYSSGNIQVSNESCAQAWFTYSNPPLLNLPVCNSALTPQTPQNILFQWTPVNLGSPNSALNTYYDFMLYEVRPDSNANVNQIVLSTQPIYSVTTQQTFINYSLIEPNLNLYMKYVWRVRVRDASGRDWFVNNGMSQICTFNYGTAKTVLGNALALNLNAQGISHRLGKATWNTQSAFSSYLLQVRKKNTSNWFDFTTAADNEKIPSLEPNTTYQCRVRGEGSITGDWSNTAEFTTLGPPNFSCNDVNILPDVLTAQPLPLSKAAPGLIIQSGQFEITAEKLTPTGPPGWYKGNGKVYVFGALPVAVKWQNIYIDDNNRHQQGLIEAETDGIDKWTHQWDVTQAEENAHYTNGTFDSVYVQNNQVCYILEGSTIPICVPTPTNANVMVVRDGEGNQYDVQLIPPPAKVTGPKNYLSYSTDSLMANDNLKVEFKQSNSQAFGFDEKQYAAFILNYEVIKLQNGKNYFVPNKGIGTDASDEVIAILTTTLTNYSPSQLSFRTANGGIIQSASEGNNSFKLMNIPADANCVYAYFNADKIGKLNIVNLKNLAKKLVLVPVNNTNITVSAADLNNIFKQANVTWTISTAPNFTFDLGNDGLEAADATLMSKYSAEMKALRTAYLQKDTAYDKSAYYVFIVPGFTDPNIKGYMVRGRAMGFIAPLSLGEGSGVRLLAHELTHGAFALEHTFPKLEKSSSNNLMDYASGSQLVKDQWEEMRNPALFPSWLDSEEDGSYQTDGHYSTIYLIGKMLGVPNYDKLAFFTEYWDNAIHDQYAIVRTTWADSYHQLATHALTNGYHSKEEFKTAVAFLNANDNDYKELGRLLHRYGDCYAHTRIEQRGSNDIIPSDSLRMYGKPLLAVSALYFGGFIYFSYTLEHHDPDKSKPDMIKNDPNWYLKYVQNVADLLKVKFNLPRSLNQEELNLFTDIAFYAKQKDVSLIGIINYIIAKFNGKSEFVIPYPVAEPGNYLSLYSTLIMKDSEIAMYETYVLNTVNFLKEKGIRFKLHRTPILIPNPTDPTNLLNTKLTLATFKLE